MKHATPEESIANLDKVREIIVDNAERLEMGLWHADTGWVKRTCAEEAVCGTQHCLAGWLQVCATDDNVRKMDAHLAGSCKRRSPRRCFSAMRRKCWRG
jgi:hypothetical protein